MEAFIRQISKHNYLLFSVLLISFLQAIILVYGDFGRQAIIANLEDLPGVAVAYTFISNYFNQLGFLRVGFEIIIRAILLFLIQYSFTAIYISCQSVASKRIAALTTWLLPALISLPTVIGTVLYLLSPPYAIGFFINLVNLVQDTFDKEDFVEGFFFSWLQLDGLIYSGWD